MSKPVFVFHAPIRELDVFEQFVTQAAKLKPFGQVQVSISTLAENSTYEMPAGGSPWHDYASRNPTPHKFFPSAKLAPFLPADHVAKNRALLLAKVEILRKHGVGAAFWSYEPNFLPEAFFEAYPHLRGPRIDHPRRSRQEEFAPCLDQEETLEMFRESMAQLVKHVPELGTFYFKTNDAGPGICWSEWAYSGMNGPLTCRNVSMGKRVAGFLNALNEGAARSGGKFDIHFSGNFIEKEKDVIADTMPKNCSLRGRSHDSLFISSLIDSCYPCKGIFQPMAVISSLQGLERPELKTIFIDFRSSYDRGYDTMEIVAKVVEIVQEFISKPAYGLIPMLQFLERLCGKWAGPDKAQTLFNAFIKLEDAFKFKRQVLGRYSVAYSAGSLRYINRPLMALPERLTAQEEAYFLPHVFNTNLNEARTDYIDLHGGRAFLEPVGQAGNPRPWITDTFYNMACEVAEIFESLSDTTVGLLLKKSSISIRIYASLIRSIANFYGTQIIRDRNKEKFAGPPILPPKYGSWDGNTDLQALNEMMRIELDNTATLIALLQNGGMECLAHSKDASQEDTFILGPDIINQLKQKMKLMREHWLDAEQYLACPHK